ncbi:MAG: response regulator [Pseudobdellovibrionaceae bacterium]
MNNTKPQIAIVDDEVDLTEVYKNIVEGNIECNVEVFNDSTQALTRFQEKKFDVISLDHRMPHLTGMGIVKILRSNEGPNKNTPIIICTGFVEEAESLVTELLENVIFLQKPFESARYIRWIRSMLSSRENKI